jgi:hypothetical protein
MGISFPLIEADLGKRLTRQELSSLLGLNYKTICKHYQELGGIRIGNRYIFFEQKVIDAIQQGIAMDRAGAEAGAEDREGILDKEGGSRLGVETEEDTHRRLEKADIYGIFSG